MIKKVIKQIASASVLSLALALTACGGKADNNVMVEQESIEDQTGEEQDPSTQEVTPGTESEQTQDITTQETQEATSQEAWEETIGKTEGAQISTDGDAQSEKQAGEASLSEEKQGEIDGETIADGAISADGQIIRLGMGYAEIEEGKWAISAKDHEKYESYTLNPRTTSGSAMSLYSEDYGYEFESFHIMVSLRNESEQPIPYLEGTVDYISIPNLARTEKLAEVVLPGGLTLESTEEELRAAYGEPASEYYDEATEFRALSFEDGDIRMTINWVGGVINEVTLSM